MIKDFGPSLILGNPFIYSLLPIEKVDHNGVTTSKFGDTITFRFIDEPHIRNINQLKIIVFRKKS